MPWGAAVGGLVAGAAGSLLGDDYGAEGYNDAAAQAALTESQIAKDQYDYWAGAYQPVEKAVIDESMKAGGLDDQEIAAGEANADVTQSFDRARRENEARYAAYGLDSPNYLSSAGSLGISEAATRGGAMTSARRGAKELGYQKRFNTAQLGRGIPSQAMAGLSSSSSSLGTLGVNASRQASADAANIAYGLAPVSKAIGTGVNSWFNTPDTGSLYSGTDYGAGYYSGSNGLSNPNWFSDGGKVKRKPRYGKGGKIYYAKGGRVRAENGLIIPGSASAPPDSVDAKVTPGEVVVNTEAVEVIGEDVLHAANKIGLMRRYDRENGRYSMAGLEAR